MDESFMLMLSNLLHLHNALDSSTSLLSSPSSSSSASSPSSLLSSSPPTPVLFFTLASLLSYLASQKKPTSTKPPSSTSITTTNPESSSSFSVSAFRALSTEHIWSLEAPLRDSQWRSMYGLSYPVFTTVVDKLKPHIAASNLSLPTDYAVGMVLSRLAHGFSAKTLASRYSLEPYLVSKITNMVTRLLATKLYPEFIKIPVSRRRLIETTQAFEELTSLPNMCGAIDGSPIKVNRGDIGGGSDDASHLRGSVLYNRLVSGDVVWDKVINVRGHHVRPYIVGDWCYPLLSFLMTPFSPNGSGSPAQNLFDGMLMKGRSVVVDAIALLKGRWKILQDLKVGLDHAPQTIVACCVLHNLCQIAREPEPETWKDPDEGGVPARGLENEKSFHYFGDSLRQALADDLHQRLSSR
ncbi:hypothetical protein H0E87_017364 [Populus deltoides]|uniref:DDE Tnp4 domain-containing protein n=1 Tax=Populus deltoides TaxID=3696 RepID=A0A8T2Y055_POPDE|nr:hypothetical protein H0E87_017364 [Populus deltoides]